MNKVPRHAFVALATVVVLSAASLTRAQGEAPQALQLSEQRHGMSPPLRDLPPGQTLAGTAHEVPLHRPHGLTGNVLPADPVLQAAPTASLSTTTDLNFLGLGVGFPTFAVQYAPPDSNLAVGDTQVVEWVNTSFVIFDKNGNRLLGPLAGNALWTGFGGLCETDNDGDPVVRYDKAAHRWVMTQFALTGGPPFYQCVAVSQTADATGSWYQYEVEMPNGYSPDYSKLGVWPDGYYLSTNLFSRNSFAGPLVCALDRDNMLNGATARDPRCFQLGTSVDTLMPADLDGATPPPPGSPNYFFSLGNNSLNMWTLTANWNATGMLVGPVAIPVAPFAEACNGGVCVPQPSTGQKLDSLGYALMYRAAYRSFADHESVVLTHSVGSPSGVRWYELRQTPSAPFDVFQQSTFAPSDGNFRWMGSIAMDQFGDIAVGYSVSGRNLYPSIAFTGCMPDASGACTMGQETFLASGGGSQIKGLNRWGDYTSMSIDPVDDCSFWYVNEYLQRSGSFNWSTRIASFRFPECPSPTPIPTSTPIPTATNTPKATPTKRKGKP